MADLDTLGIGIEAEDSKAIESLNAIIDKLGEVQTALDGLHVNNNLATELSSIADGMGSIKTAMDGLDVKGLKAFSSAIGALKKDSPVEEVKDDMQEFAGVSKDVAAQVKSATDDIIEQYNIKGKGNQSKLYSLVENVYKAIGNNGDVEKARKELEEFISITGKIRIPGIKELADIYDHFRRIKMPEGLKKEWGEKFARNISAIGIGRFSKNGAWSIEDFVRDVEDMFGYHGFDGLDNPFDMMSKMVEIAELAKSKWMDFGDAASEAMKKAVGIDAYEHLSMDLDAIFNKQNRVVEGVEALTGKSYGNSKTPLHDFVEDLRNAQYQILVTDEEFEKFKDSALKDIIFKFPSSAESKKLTEGMSESEADAFWAKEAKRWEESVKSMSDISPDFKSFGDFFDAYNSEMVESGKIADDSFEGVIANLEKLKDIAIPDLSQLSNLKYLKDATGIELADLSQLEHLKVLEGIDLSSLKDIKQLGIKITTGETGESVKEIKNTVSGASMAVNSANEQMSMSFEDVVEAVDAESQHVYDLIQRRKELNALVKDMEGGKAPFDLSAWDSAKKEIRDITAELKGLEKAATTTDVKALPVGAINERITALIKERGDLQNIVKQMNTGKLPWDDDSFVKAQERIAEINKELEVHNNLLFNKQGASFMDEEAKQMQQVYASIREYKALIDGVRKGTILVDSATYKNAIAMYEKLKLKAREYEDALKPIAKSKKDGTKSAPDVAKGFEEAKRVVTEASDAVNDSFANMGQKAKGAINDIIADAESRLKEFSDILSRSNAGELISQEMVDRAKDGIKSLAPLVNEYYDNLKKKSQEAAATAESVSESATKKKLQIPFDSSRLNTEIKDAVAKIAELQEYLRRSHTGEIKFNTDGVKKANADIVALQERLKNLSFKVNDEDMFSIINRINDLNEYLEKVRLNAKDNRFDIDPASIERAQNELSVLNNLIVNVRNNLSEPVRGNAVEGVKHSADATSTAMYNLNRQMEYFRQQMNDMNSGKIPFDASEMQRFTDGYRQASEALDRYKQSVNSAKGDNTSFLANLLVLANGIKNVTGRLDGVANKLAKGLIIAYTPLKLIANEYKEKIQKITGYFANFRKAVQTNLDKLSQFWKRSMRTFTFMLVRKAITAVLKDIKAAVDSLSQFEGITGRWFNKSISTLYTDMRWIGANIVAMFAPIINAITPIIDALVDKLAVAISYINAFFAALTGKSVYTTAKKNMIDYGAEIADNAKKQKEFNKQLMDFDDLNIITLPKDSGAGKGSGIDYPYEWLEHNVPDWLKDLADKTKNVFKDLFEPLKKAWDVAGDYVIKGFKYMGKQMRNLLKDIGRDFLAVWKQPQTQKIFEGLLFTIGNIAHAVGNLAKNFDEAWKKNETGKRILENIRDILGIIVQHAERTSQYLKEWSVDIDFSPILEGFLKLTESLKPVADFIGGVFEDIMERTVLRYIKFMIEDGIPHFEETLAGVFDSFNFPKIRKDLQPVEDAFANLLENIHTGVTNAIGNLGKEIAEFTNSEEFTKFMQRIADILNLIDAELVEKILTALGKGILNVAKSLVKFVNSDGFMVFLEKTKEWIMSKDVDELAKIFERIAIAIAAFKFSAFVGAGFVNFVQFISIVSSAKSLKGILTGMGTGAASAGKGFSVMSGASVGAIAGIGLIAAGVATLATTNEDFRIQVKEIWNDISGYLKGMFGDLGELAVDLGWAFRRLAYGFKVFVNLWYEYGGAGFIDAFTSPFRDLYKALADVVGMIKHLAGAVVKILQGDWAGAWEEAKGFVEDTSDAISTVSFMPFKAIGKGIKGFGEGLFNIGSDIFKGATGSGEETLAFKSAFNSMSKSMRKELGISEDAYSNFAEHLKKTTKTIKEEPPKVGVSLEELAKSTKKVSEETSKSFSDAEKVVKAKSKAIEDSMSGIKVGEKYSKSLEGIKNATDSSLNGISGKYKETWSNVTKDTESEISKMSSSVEKQMGEVKSKAKQGLNGVQSENKAVWSGVEQDTSNTIKKMSDGTSKGFNEIGTIIITILEEILRTISATGNDMTKISTNNMSQMSTAYSGKWNEINRTTALQTDQIRKEVVEKMAKAKEGGARELGNLSTETGNKMREINASIKTISEAERSISRAMLASREASQTHLSGIAKMAVEMVDAIKRIFGDLEDSMDNMKKRADDVTSKMAKSASDAADSMSKSFNSVSIGRVKSKLQSFATGGFPEDGLFFANSTELVGRFDNGKTAVANNEQITEGIKGAVVDAIVPYLMPVLNDIASSNRKTASKEFGITSREAFNAVRDESVNYFNMTGNPAFPM